MPPLRREAAIAKLIRATLDGKAAMRRANRCLKRTRLLRIFAQCLFVVCFIAAPAAVWLRGFSSAAPWLLAALALLLFWIGWEFRRVHKSLFARLRAQRVQGLFSILVLPPAAIRAADLILRETLCTFHPLALAHELCEEPDFLAYARRLLLELQHPLAAHLPSDPAARDREHRSRLRLTGILHSHLANAWNCPVEQLEAPLAPGIGAVSYCPRCDAQFVAADAVCRECDLKTRLFPDPAPAPPEEAGGARQH